MICKYKGTRYKATIRDEEVLIISKEEREGFENYINVVGRKSKTSFMKVLDKSEIESLYHERIYFQYKGMVLTAGGINKRGIDENSFLVFGATEKQAREYGFKGNFRDGYERFIKLEEIERIIVKKTPVKGFEEFFNVEETEVVEKENVKEWIKLAASLQKDPRDREWP